MGFLAATSTFEALQSTASHVKPTRTKSHLMTISLVLLLSLSHYEYSMNLDRRAGKLQLRSDVAAVILVLQEKGIKAIAWGVMEPGQMGALTEMKGVAAGCEGRIRPEYKF